MAARSSYFPGRGTLFEERFFAGKAEGQAEGKAEGKAEGRAEGLASALVRVLEGRKIALSAAERERVIACTDLDALGVWLDRALDAVTVHEVFGEEGRPGVGAEAEASEASVSAGTSEERAAS
ncbi:hypothetical protein [Streptomyces sp. 8L]|uniref:hypothetical protein n=1 Tax=Streptomyces sp. 8L TaxID=2877242 RepID=UPI001CD1D27E|nr:hypothetical protein [Streptomyces sp. 8L]MCA1222524.1 hypothetical protein [Streptomyces sp. 8L]